MLHLVFYIKSFMVNRREQGRKAACSARHTASTTNTNQKTHSSAAAEVKVLAPSSTSCPVTMSSHPKPQPAYKGSKSSTSAEPKEIQGQAAADLPTISDAIQGLLDLQGGSPVKDLETVSSEGEEEAVKPIKRKRMQAESEEGEEDKDEKSSDLSNDKEDEGMQIRLTTF
jgi:hypothetical protein